MDTKLWEDARARALARDGHTCTVARLFGGRCSPGPLHVHHIVARSEGGALYDLDNLGTTCSAHHPFWESLRRTLVRRLVAPLPVPRCPHRHVTRAAREQCERQMASRFTAVA